VKPVEDLACFLAHAVVLEDEAASRYDELADSMAVHHNREVEALFRKMAKFSRMHRDEAIERAESSGSKLPGLKPWEFEWQDDESPESGAMDQAHYLMTAHHALQLAIAAERRAERFYARIGRDAQDAGIRALAQEFAAEEAEHAEALERWLESQPRPASGWDEDPDPPVEVE